MPTYRYTCTTCGHDYEEFHKIADRNIPVEGGCNKCGNKTLYINISGGSVGDPYHLGRVKMPQEWKGFLERMKKANPNSKINV